MPTLRSSAPERFSSSAGRSRTGSTTKPSKATAMRMLASQKTPRPSRERDQEANAPGEGQTWLDIGRSVLRYRRPSHPGPRRPRASLSPTRCTRRLVLARSWTGSGTPRRSSGYRPSSRAGLGPCGSVSGWVAGRAAPAMRRLLDLARVARFSEPPRDVLGLSRGADVALPSGKHVPVQRALQVLPHAVPVLVEAADDVLRADIAPLCGRFVPLRGELPVLGRAPPQEILRRELDLRLRVALLRGLLPPGRGGSQGAGHPDAALRKQSHVVLRLRAAGVGRAVEPCDTAGEVPRAALTPQQHHRHVELSEAVALLRRRLVDGERLRVIAAPVRSPARIVRGLQRRRHRDRCDRAGEKPS